MSRAITDFPSDRGRTRHTPATDRPMDTAQQRELGSECGLDQKFPLDALMLLAPIAIASRSVFARWQKKFDRTLPSTAKTADIAPKS
eukprot:727059-Hanusia_phi.AAC.2